MYLCPACRKEGHTDVVLGLQGFRPVNRRDPGLRYRERGSSKREATEFAVNHNTSRCPVHGRGIQAVTALSA